MKANTNNKHSAKKKLIPAVAMLTTSAIMLSTATYAWFTMNKEVQVTGLSMSATASDGLEISLGSMTGGTTPTITAPRKDDYSWKRAIQFADYYEGVGKLMPASSDDALDIYTIAETGVYAGGHAVEDGTAISYATKKDSATMTLKTTTNDTALTVLEAEGTEGYYIDIPMWIRSSNQVATDVYATVTITDPDSTNGSELIKAARVAIIPIAKADKEEDSCDVSYASATYTAESLTESTVSPLASSTTTIFGLKAKGSSEAMDTNTAIDWPTYHDGSVIKTTGAYSVAERLGTTSLNAARGLGETGIDATNVFTIPAATPDDYGRVGFVARIWLEGESIYCEDATANQDWNIDFYFSTEDTALADYTAP